MAINWFFPVRIAQLVLAIIELGLTGYVTSLFLTSPSEVDFMVFNSVWSLLVVIVLLLAPRYDPDGRHVGHKFTILALDAVTALFWFAGFIALSVWIGAPECDGNSFCGATQAACVFGAFLWILFTATAALDAMHVFRTRGHRSSKPAAEVQSASMAV